MNLTFVMRRMEESSAKQRTSRYTRTLQLYATTFSILLKKRKVEKKRNIIILHGSKCSIRIKKTLGNFIMISL